tara:strand:+ start:138 stop:491 length:354 start_codon:yes stop_codon:yes gene_type:complete
MKQTVVLQESSPNKTESSADESIEDGKRSYIEWCTDCHGESGSGDGPLAGLVREPPSDLTDDIWSTGGTDEDLIAVIRTGTRTGMRGYDSKFDAEELQNLVKYIRVLAKQSSPPNYD